MATLVPDTSALVSLGTVSGGEPDPLSIAFEHYEIVVPQAVVDELEETATYDDLHGRAAEAALEYVETVEISDGKLDESFPLDDGENAAVTLANDRAEDLLLCDEFNQLSIIHASLSETRLVTTPTFLLVFSRREWLSEADTRTILSELANGRSWETNAYVERVRARLEPE